MISTSTIRISVVIAAADLERAARPLHTAFGLDTGATTAARSPNASSRFCPRNRPESVGSRRQNGGSRRVRWGNLWTGCSTSRASSSSASPSPPASSSSKLPCRRSASPARWPSIAGGFAVAGIVEQDATWWPLLGPAFAVVIWAVMIARQRRSPVGEVVAAAAFAARRRRVRHRQRRHDEHGRHRRRHAAARLRLPAAPRRRDPARPAASAHRHGGARRPHRVGRPVGPHDRRRHDRRLALERRRRSGVRPRPGDPVTVVGFHGTTVEVWPPPAWPAVPIRDRGGLPP